MTRARILGVLCALLTAVPSSAGAMDFASLQAQVLAHGITTIEGLIQALPESLRTDYTLAFHSRSLQGATYANPRAILFGNDASLVVTFNGDPMERGYDAVETMEFDAPTSSFRFREIRFGEPGVPPTISDANPARCTACHGAPARPIWDTPPSWPGVYGERYRSGLSAQEAKGIREYLALQPGNPRYGALIGSRRFADRDTYVTSSKDAYNGRTAEPPNAQLSRLLTKLNTRAIIATLRSQPGYAAHRYVLLAAAQGDCGSLGSFYPSALRSSFDRQLRVFLDSLERTDRRQEMAKATRLTDGSAPRSLGVRPLDMGTLRFVVERGLGVSTEFWTLALEHNTYDLAAPPDSWSFNEALLEAVTSTDSDLADLRAYRSFDTRDPYCQRLAERSRQALGAWYVNARGSLPTSGISGTEPGTAAHSTNTSSPAPALALCIACHSGEVAPQIPFGNPETLGPLLTGGDYPRGRLLDEILYRLSDAAGNARMPRGSLLSGDQVQALEAYFVGLANKARD